MCGITGWINFRQDLRNAGQTLSGMAKTMANRGPDEANVWLGTHAAFGHRRLTVVDPEGGRQPMSISKGGSTYTICYNGELYNTEELRKTLVLKGYSFNGHSDTEVLLTAYIEWKEGCLEYLNGIFAFAVWDDREEKLFIGRDRLGVKPLFYSEAKGGFLFGSEQKAILAHSGMKPEVNREGLSELFGLGPSRSPGAGIFRGIDELRPAHALTFSKSGLKVWRYWNVKSATHNDSLEETAEKVGFLFTDAVKRQLVSDVPLCTFLSGGLDSSAITAVAAEAYAQEGKGPLHTYSIDYEENGDYFRENEFQPNSDGAWIQMMSESYGTVHQNCTISQQLLAERLGEAVRFRDVPGMADIDSSLLWFCEEVKKKFTVSLSGECADEIFGGYPWFRRSDDLARDGFPWMRSTSDRQGMMREDWQKKLNLGGYVMDRYKETLLEVPSLEGEAGEEARRRELFYLNMVWFMTTLLERKDRMSMGASLEVRVPFADHRLVEYAWNIPWEMKMHGNREKGILRKALEGVLPDEVLYRKKSPYPKTHHPAYTRGVQSLLAECLEDKASALHEFFDRSLLEKLIETGGASFGTPWFGQLMTGPQLLAHIAQIHIWFKEYNVNIVE
ncbi:asparagine synthase (glutamine-hydrolyzing) [Mesobacillus zeae]|uniref:asparagine synthase (glutamine-hydrolyzing) n=1 Tax=Mesobacillus zeae TaxID=1917180 RepID=A0A398B6X7_9BACI|nr:asparagine synthase (glutamine-hydrolyzing) [Mesobacillus zeae]RID84578.1 asparagine synthase (glutamine-hydrolyzing) [Mesobacillus zeae]